VPETATAVAVGLGPPSEIEVCVRDGEFDLA